MSEDFLTVAVPGYAATVTQLKSRLEEMGLAGWIIDGACVAYPGWVLARLALNNEPDTDELRAQLVVTWPDVRLDEVEVSSGVIVGPAGPSSSAPLCEVGVARTKGLGLDVEAECERMRLAEVRSGERSVFARARPFKGPEHALIDVFSTAKGGSVLLQRRGPRVVLHVLKGGDVVAVHVWEPTWTAVGGDDFDELRVGLLPAAVDAAEIVDVLQLSSESVMPLRELMSRESPPLDGLCALLRLPPEVVRVLSGEYAVEKLPGAVVHEIGGELGWRDLLTVPLGMFVFGGGVVRWINGGSTVWGVIGAIGLLVTIKTVVDGWINWRRCPRPVTD